tara:strand:+ start:3086 stop:3460 length:375 start_codon:yes stop_codon:yes gene_type:complete
MSTVGIVKLVSGEELLADIIEYKEHIRLTNPVLVCRHNTHMGPVISVAWWLTFAAEQTIEVPRDKIVAFKYGVEDNAERHYIRFVNSERDEQMEHEHKRRTAEVGAQQIIDNLMKGGSSNTTIH